MVQQRNIKPQEGSEKGDLLMKLPPEGTQARNRIYYPYTSVLEAEKKLKNPLKIKNDVVARGRVSYMRYCVYCHGTYGDGKEGALVAPRMAVPPPSLLTDKARGYSDGRIYHIIYNGQGLMGSYRTLLGTNEQVLKSHMKAKTGTYEGWHSIWAVVNYVRVLQKGKRQ